MRARVEWDLPSATECPTSEANELTMLTAGMRRLHPVAR